MAIMSAAEMKELENEVLNALSGITEEDRAWRAMTAALAYWEGTELAGVILPNLSSEARHYNAGRAANVEALRDWLTGQMKKAQELRAKRLDKQAKR